LIRKTKTHHWTKTPKPRHPNWLKRLGYFRQDIPNFLEVDFLTMTIIIIYKPLYFYEFDKNVIKFVSAYQSRIYNWRYII
jgi:hypothetical protein